MVSILLWFVIQWFYSGSVPLLQHITPFPPPSPPSLSRACVCAASGSLSRARTLLNVCVRRALTSNQEGGRAKMTYKFKLALVYCNHFLIYIICYYKGTANT